MTAIWYDPPSCMVLGSWCEAQYCKECIAAHKHVVDIVSFGSGLAFGSAIIKLSDGQLKKVSVNHLTILEKKDKI